MRFLRHWLPPPRTVAGLDAAGGLHWYRVKRRWDGRLDAVPAPGPGKRPLVVMTGIGLPFRRRVVLRANDAAARQALRRAAGEYFPASLTDATHATHDLDGETLVLALPADTLETLRQQTGDPDALLVCRDPATATEVTATLRAWHATGSGVDLARSPKRPMAWSWITLGASTLLLCLIAAAGQLAWTAWHPGPDTLARRLAALENENRDTLRQLDTVQRMGAATAALGEAGGPGVEALRTLDGMLRTQPATVTLGGIRLQGGVLKLTGQGAGAKPWLLNAGFAEGDIQITEAGDKRLFSAERPLGRPPAPAAATSPAERPAS